VSRLTIKQQSNAKKFEQKISYELGDSQKNEHNGGEKSPGVCQHPENAPKSIKKSNFTQFSKLLIFEIQRNLWIKFSEYKI